MIRASVEVKDENSAFSIAVCAENLERVVEYAAIRYPGRTVRVRFPLDPEMFFVEGTTFGTETVELGAADGSQQERGSDEAIEASAARRPWGSTAGTSTGLSKGERAAS
jgi:hypothetical protein